MRRIYEPTAYGPLPDAGNFWRTTVVAPTHPALEADTTAEFAIIGAGYTGLSAALTLARAGVDVIVLEAEQPGWGASGRNGGFCCLGGSKLEDAKMVARYGTDQTRQFHHATRAAIDLVSGILNTFDIDADRHSQGETLMAHRPNDVASLEQEAVAMQAVHGVNCHRISRAELAEYGMASPAFHGALTMPIGFALNPMKYLLGLANAAKQAGARIFGASLVTGITPARDGYELRTPKARVRAAKLLVATNGYSSDDLPLALRNRYLPVQSNVLVSRPLSAAEIAAQGWSTAQMCYDTRHLLHYFRLMPDRRMLFGMRGAVRTTPASLRRTRRRIRADFDAMFPAWAHVETPHFWAGLVCLSRSLAPFAGPLPDMPGAYAALAYHGNGLAMGSYAGQQVAKMALGQAHELPGFMQAPLQRFPLGRFRRAILPPVYGWYGVKDRG